MATYTVYLQTIASTSVEVEADNEDEALDKAYDASMPTICAQCSGWGKESYLELGDVWEANQVADADGKVVWEDRPKRED